MWRKVDWKERKSSLQEFGFSFNEQAVKLNERSRKNKVEANSLEQMNWVS